MTPPASPILVAAPGGPTWLAVGDALRRAGFPVVEATTGAEILRLAPGADLVVLAADVADPAGAEVCRRLKADPATAGVPVLYLAATFTDPADPPGADAYLPGGAEPPVLVAAVRALVRLRRAEEAVRENDRRRAEFLAILAHELRNPLAPIRNALHIQQLTGADPVAAAATRDIIGRQVGHLVRLVDELLDLSRVSRGRIELRPAPVDLSDVIAEAVETTRPAVEAGRHELSVALPDPPVVVHADPGRLAQVVATLLDNAAKYTDPGGRVALTAAREDGHAVVRVRDTGVGIPAGMLDRVWEPFAQLDPGRTRIKGGLGIGLSLAKRLVELHGGAVTATSPGPGAGSEFVVRLPLGQPTPGASEPPRIPPSV